MRKSRWSYLIRDSSSNINKCAKLSCREGCRPYCRQAFTDACLTLARLHPLRNHIVKVTRDVGRSTDPVFTTQTCKETLYKKSKTTMSNEKIRKSDAVFCPTLPFWSEAHRRRTDRMWPFQRDHVMHEDSVRQAFMVKKYIHFYFLRKWPLDKTLIPRLWSRRAHWPLFCFFLVFYEFKNVQLWVKCNAYHCQFLPSRPITVEEGRNKHRQLQLYNNWTTMAKK